MSDVKGRANRLDIFAADAIGPPKELPNGFWRVDGRIARIGIQLYQDANGSHREFRPPEEVFDKESMDSFAMVPVTNTHPPGLLDAEVARRYTVGCVGEALKRDGDYLAAPMMVHDAEAIFTAKAGRQQLSCGYTCELDPTPGVYNGQPYDVVQRKIRGNHVALVDQARAGAEARLRMDSNDIAVSGLDGPVTPKETPMGAQQLKIDDLDLEMNEANAPVIQKSHNKAVSREKERADTAEKAVAALTKQVADLTAQLDAMVKCKDCKGSGKVDGEKCDDCEGKGKVEGDKMDAVFARHVAKKAAEIAPGIIAARSALEAEARPVLGTDADLSKLDDAGVRALVVKTLAPEMKTDGVDMATAYRIVLALKAKNEKNEVSAVDKARAAAASVRGDAAPDPYDPEAARLRMVERTTNAWKTKETK